MSGGERGRSVGDCQHLDRRRCRNRLRATIAPAAFAKADPTLEALEWTPLRAELRQRGLLDIKGLFVISPSWIDMGKIYRALDDAMPMLGHGEVVSTWLRAS